MREPVWLEKDLVTTVRPVTDTPARRHVRTPRRNQVSTPPWSDPGITSTTQTTSIPPDSQPSTWMPSFPHTPSPTGTSGLDWSALSSSFAQMDTKSRCPRWMPTWSSWRSLRVEPTLQPWRRCSGRISQPLSEARAPSVPFRRGACASARNHPPPCASIDARRHLNVVQRRYTRVSRWSKTVTVGTSQWSWAPKAAVRRGWNWRSCP